jgi:hypothetical protein
MKTLIYFPVIHTQADMGALRESIKRVTLHKLGQATFKQKKVLIDRMWDKIEQVIEDLNLQFGKVRLYQDGLPVCGREVEIIKDLAEAESRNHKLLLRLMEKGAKIMGTESSELLLEEYQLIKQIMDEGGAQDLGKTIYHNGIDDLKTSQKALSDLLLSKRDQFIAERINSTVGAGETGILFLGMLHSVEKLLDKRIRVFYPINRPHYPVT